MLLIRAHSGGPFLFGLEMKNFRPRRCVVEDFDEVGAIIADAYAIWASYGFVVTRPAHEQLAKYLLKDGWVFEHPDTHEVIGVVCLTEANQKVSKKKCEIHLPHKSVETNLSEDVNGRYMFFYTLAVAPKYGKSSYGRQILDWIEEKAKNEMYEGLLLETGRDTTWLCEWYLKLGFSVIGHSEENSKRPPTVLMIKTF